MAEAKRSYEKRKINLLYLVEPFPVLSQTYIQREIIEMLRDEDLDVRVINFQKGDENIPLPSELISKILHIGSPGRLEVLKSNSFMFLRSTIKYLGLVSLILFGKHNRLVQKSKDLASLRFGVWLSTEIRNLEIDHIHAHWATRSTTIALVLSKFLGIPFSFTAHAHDIYLKPMLLKEKIAAAKAVATCTNFNRNYLANSVSPGDREKIFTVYHGVDFKTLRFGRKKVNKVPVVLAVGRLVAFKGFTYLVDALDLVKKQGGNFKAAIIGGGPEFENLESRIKEKNLAGNIELLGELPFEEVRKYFEEADIFVAPSIMTSEKAFDGLPNVLIEAMASKTPVVATSVSGIPEAIKNGENGLLVEEKDPKALSEAIQVLLKDEKLRRDFGEAGYMKALKMFDIEKNVKRLKQVILEDKDCKDGGKGRPLPTAQIN